MWVMLNNSFLSIVQDMNYEDNFLVRARVEGDIETIFPEATVVEGAGTDYLYRTSILKTEVGKTIQKKIMDIDYPNFKNSVPWSDTDRHTAYGDVWIQLRKLQKS